MFLPDMRSKYIDMNIIHGGKVHEPFETTQNKLCVFLWYFQAFQPTEKVFLYFKKPGIDPRNRFRPQSYVAHGGPSPNFQTFKEAQKSIYWNRFLGSLEFTYSGSGTTNPIPTRFLAPLDGSKITAKIFKKIISCLFVQEINIKVSACFYEIIY